MYLMAIPILFSAGFAVARLEERGARPVNRAQVALGTLVEIQVRGADDAKANRAITAAFQEIRRIENLLVDAARYDAGEILADPQLSGLLAACAHYWEISAGAFDCAAGPLVDAWGFASDHPRVPAAQVLERAMSVSGWQSLAPLSDGSWQAIRPVSLTFGAIGKGYAVDRAMAVLVEHGIGEALVNAGGDMRMLGKNWVVGVQHPRQADALAAMLALDRGAVATSGDYEQYFTENGQRYHHILDPRTGFPPAELQSVTVVAPTCLEADALATAVFVLGESAGLSLVESLPGVEVYMIRADSLEIVSSGFVAFMQGEN